MKTKEDIDKLLRLAGSVKRTIAIGENVMEDGEVTFGDLDQVAPLAKEVKEMIELKKHYKEMVAEGKDIDPVEAVQLLQAILA